MLKTFRVLSILLFIAAGLPVTTGIDTATVSITAAPQFAIEPACVQSCVYYNSFDVADYLLFGLGCTSTIYNACYCTQIVDQSASTLLSNCVNTLCDGTTEISGAISLYESYCAGAGYPRSITAQTTSTVVSTSSASQIATVTSTTTSPAPSTSSSSPSTAASSSSASSLPWAGFPSGTFQGTSLTPSTAPQTSSTTPPSSTSSAAVVSTSTTSKSGTKPTINVNMGYIVEYISGIIAFLALAIGIF